GSNAVGLDVQALAPLGFPFLQPSLALSIGAALGLVGVRRRDLLLGGLLLRRLLARLAVFADALVNWSDRSSCLRLLPGPGHGRMGNTGQFGEQPVGLLGLRRDKLDQRLLLLLGGEIPATEVLGDDVGDGIGDADGVFIVAREAVVELGLNTSGETCAIT